MFFPVFFHTNTLSVTEQQGSCLHVWPQSNLTPNSGHAAFTDELSSNTYVIFSVHYWEQSWGTENIRDVWQHLHASFSDEGKAFILKTKYINCILTSYCTAVYMESAYSE